MELSGRGYLPGLGLGGIGMLPNHRRFCLRNLAAQPSQVCKWVVAMKGTTPRLPSRPRFTQGFNLLA